MAMMYVTPEHVFATAVPLDVSASRLLMDCHGNHRSMACHALGSAPKLRPHFDNLDFRWQFLLVTVLSTKPLMAILRYPKMGFWQTVNHKKILQY